QRVIDHAQDRGRVEVGGVIGDEDVAAAALERRVVLHGDARAADAQEEPGPEAQHALGAVALAEDADQRGAAHGCKHNHRPAEQRAQKADHVRALAYSAAAGKSSTSEMLAAPVSS